MPRYRGPITDHFDGKRFHNLDNPDPKGFGGFLRWTLERKPGPWRKWTDAPPGPPPPPRVAGGRLRVTFVNHSTVLIQMDGINILTDPIWSMRASPFSSVGPRRHRPPGLRLEDLPPIDLVLLSHNHYDHLDLPSLALLNRRSSPGFVVPLGVRGYLRSKGILDDSQGVALDWWQSHEEPGGVRVTGVPAKHFSGRGLRDRNASLWCGYVIEGASGSVYFAGDTGSGKHFSLIAERFPRLRLALLPIGIFRPRWFMSPVHMSPEDAVRAHCTLGAAVSVGIHFGTFRLADDGEREPLVELERALKDAGSPIAHFWALDFGEGKEIPPA